MTFISFAQNFEDVMLWRALHDLIEMIYIDVGAGDPVMHSVTNTFYQRGWHGINIEADPRYFARLQEHRPRDINLHAAAASLAAICRTHVSQPVAFLRVDAEGTEQAVLAGADWQHFRPRLVVVKTAWPFRPKVERPPPPASEWQASLQRADYQPVYFDGLNRFYAAAEHYQALAPIFATPPNVLDDFVRSDEAAARLMRDAHDAALQAVTGAERRIARADYEMTRAEWRITQMRLDARRMWERDIGRKDLDLAEKDEELASRAARLVASEQHLQVLQGVIHEMYNSTTWKLGRPVRLIIFVLRRLRRMVTPDKARDVDGVEAAALEMSKPDAPKTAAITADYQPEIPRPPPAALSLPVRPRASQQEAALIGRFRGEPPGL